MRKHSPAILMLCVLPVFAGAAEPAKPEPKQDQQKQATEPQSRPPVVAKQDGDVALSGMSILGNDEAPKSLVIVPWKSSRLGETPGIQRLLDDSTQPVDREVFMRELTYYEIKKSSR